MYKVYLDLENGNINFKTLFEASAKGFGKLSKIYFESTLISRPIKLLFARFKFFTLNSIRYL